jgi:hypothetical protein
MSTSSATRSPLAPFKVALSALDAVKAALRGSSHTATSATLSPGTGHRHGRSASELALKLFGDAQRTVTRSRGDVPAAAAGGVLSGRPPYRFADEQPEPDAALPYSTAPAITRVR